MCGSRRAASKQEQQEQRVQGVYVKRCDRRIQKPTRQTHMTLAKSGMVPTAQRAGLRLCGVMHASMCGAASQLITTIHPRS
jgi:hypothetical protein